MLCLVLYYMFDVLYAFQRLAESWLETECLRLKNNYRGPQVAGIRVEKKGTVGFHNFNLRIFVLRVSNPNKLSVDVFLTRCRISMCQGLGPKRNTTRFRKSTVRFRRVGDFKQCCFKSSPPTPCWESSYY